MISASLNLCKGMEDQVGDFLKQLAAKLELVLLFQRGDYYKKWGVDRSYSLVLAAIHSCTLTTV